MKKWKCSVCGYVHTGDSAPGACPVCGVDKSKILGNNRINKIIAGKYRRPNSG